MKLANWMSISLISGGYFIDRDPRTQSSIERNNEKEILVLTNVVASDTAMSRFSAIISASRE